MLEKNFNVIVGTNFRVDSKENLKTLDWLLNNSDYTNIKELDKAFKEFVLREKITSYKEIGDKRNRVSQVMNDYKKLGILDYNNLRSKKNSDSCVNWDKNFRKIYKHNKANALFIAMQNFLKSNQKMEKEVYPFLDFLDHLNTNYKDIQQNNKLVKLVESFLVYDKKESYKTLLTSNIEELLVKKAVDKVVNNEEGVNLKDYVNGSKQTTGVDHLLVQILTFKKSNSRELTELDFKKPVRPKEYKNFLKALYEKFGIDKKRKANLTDIVDEFNNNSFKNLFERRMQTKYRYLMGTYSDSLFRLLVGLKLVNVKKVKGRNVYTLPVDKMFEKASANDNNTSPFSSNKLIFSLV